MTPRPVSVGFRLAAVLCAILATASAARAAPPNFVVIFVDDLGYGDIGPFGATRQKTPQLDRMAAEGMRLTSFYAAPVCSVSRAQLLTGCYGVRVGVPGVFFPAGKHGLAAGEFTIAERLKPLGYATSCVGKWHLGDQPEFLPTRQGFDRYFGIPYSNDMHRESAATGEKVVPLVRDERVEELLTDAEQPRIVERYTEEAVRFIEQSRDRPFFLYLPHTAVHAPIMPGERFRGASGNGKFGDWVEELDWSVGRILDTLRSAGIAENTLVIFSSDNGPWTSVVGDATSAGPLRGSKGSTWEGGVRVPTLAWWPGRIPPGSTCDAVAGTIDLLPTLVQLAGGSVPAEPVIDGRDIGPLLLEGSRESPRGTHFYFSGNTLEAVRRGPWKLAIAPQPAGMGRKNPKQDPTKDPTRNPANDPEPASREVPRLYNLDDDIGERENVAGRHPDVVAELKAAAARMEEELGKPGSPGRRPAGTVEAPRTLYPTAAPRSKEGARDQPLNRPNGRDQKRARARTREAATQATREEPREESRERIPDQPRQQSPDRTVPAAARQVADGAATQPRQRPNIVLLLADDLGYGELAAFGNPAAVTPNLDRLAAEGLVLTDCHSACPVCSPSRAALLTGRHPYRTGVFTWIPEGSPIHLRTSEITLPKLLREAGYDTCHVGKWHLNGLFNSPDQPQPHDHGYAWWLGTQNNAAPSHAFPDNFVRNGRAIGRADDHSAPFVAREAAEWLRRKRDPAKPFFLAVWTHEPHYPIASAERYERLHAGVADPVERTYRANVTQLDAAVGMVLEAIDEVGAADSTLVFFTSDNGPEGDGVKGPGRGLAGGLRGRKRSVYEGGHRVPGIIRWPGKIEPGTRSDLPVIGSDFFPTALKAAGLEPPAGLTLDGVDIGPEVTIGSGAGVGTGTSAGGVERPQPMYWRWGGKVAFREGSWKLVANEKLGNAELYDLATDRAERHDQAGAEPQRLAGMLERLRAHAAAIEAEGPDWWRKQPENGSPKQPATQASKQPEK